MISRSELHAYQRVGVDFITETGKCALWLDLGLGKTVTTLTAIVDLLDAVDVFHILVISPLRVAKSTWPNELRNWDHLSTVSYAVACGTPKQRIDALNQRADVTMINIENIDWLVKELGQKWHFDMVVIDESSAFKAHNTKRFRALKRVSNKIDRMVQLTGTPAPNGLHQLWPQLFLLDNGKRLMKTIGGFRSRFCRPIHMGPHVKWEVRPDAVPLIYEAVEDVTLTMKSDDYIAMPDKIEIFHDIELAPKERKTYLELEKHCLLEVDGDDITAVNAAALSIKLLQFANGAVYRDNGGYETFHNAKLDVLATMIDEANGKPMLVAYYFKSDLERLKERFPAAVTLDKDPRTIDRWNTGNISMMFVHPASAGHGLNLQAGGSVIVWFSLIWSLELYLQLIGRLLRQGQGASCVLVHHLNIIGSIDDDVVASIRGKYQCHTALFNALKHRIEGVSP